MPDIPLTPQHAGTQSDQLWRELCQAKAEIERLRAGYAALRTALDAAEGQLRKDREALFGAKE